MREYTPHEVEFYEGLVRKTAQRLGGLEMEREDVEQELRIKVFQALGSYDPARARQTVQGYVFTCVYNRTKDLMKRPRRGVLHIEDLCGDPATEYGRLARERFERRYLCDDGEIIPDDVPVLPNTLSAEERSLVFLLWNDYSRREAGRQLGCTTREVEARLRSIRMKLADWAPTGEGVPEAEAAA